MNRNVYIYTAIITLFIGCTIPCDVLIRNLSNKPVRLNIRLESRQIFDKLPNKVAFYNLPDKQKDILGNREKYELVNWVDSNTFYIDLPAKTIINIKDISNGLKLGAQSPNIFLTASTSSGIDTLTTGDYSSLVIKFKSIHEAFSNPVYFYDFK